MVHRAISNKLLQIDALDGLRGLAALIVVLSHTSNLNMFFIPAMDFRGIGKSGVFLFFLLSSFLLTRQIITTSNKIFTFEFISNYWQRRFFRIYPLYTFYLLLALVTTWASVKYFGVGYGQPFNLDLYGLFNQLILTESRGLTWSIAVEFKFYFVLPLLAGVFLLVRHKGLIACSALYVCLILLSQYLSPEGESLLNDPRFTPYLPIFITGIFVAFLQEALQDKAWFPRLCQYLGYIGVVAVITMTPTVYSLITAPVESNYFHKDFILYAAVWSLVLLAAVNHDGLLKKALSTRPLRTLGTLSFSIYLFHPIFIIGALYYNMGSFVAAWFVLLASLATAYLTFRYIEQPSSRFKFQKTNFTFSRS